MLPEGQSPDSNGAIERGGILLANSKLANSKFKINKFKIDKFKIQKLNNEKMEKLKTIVVEDERLPRLSLLKKLEAYRHTLEVVDACDSYDSARQSILLYRPDLLLLDIQLQGRDAIELLRELKETMPLPYVIFTTAYSERKYLLSAIKLGAVDYLLKPIDKAQLAHAIAKAAGRAQSCAPTPQPEQERISFRSVNGKIRVAPGDIACFKAEGNYAQMITFSGQDLVLENLLTLEQRLPPHIFVRADRSTIVNTERIYRLNNQQHTCTLQADDGRLRQLKLSKNGIELLMTIMK